MNDWSTSSITFWKNLNKSTGRFLKFMNIETARLSLLTSFLNRLRLCLISLFFIRLKNFKQTFFYKSVFFRRIILFENLLVDLFDEVFLVICRRSKSWKSKKIERNRRRMKWQRNDDLIFEWLIWTNVTVFSNWLFKLLIWCCCNFL